MDARNKRWKSYIEEKIEDYKSAFKQKGITGLNEAICEELNAWKNEPVNIAVTGASGAGKSSLINAILGLSAEDDRAAAVGCTETTMTIKSYKHPRNKRFMIWDFPGVGTKKFPKESYLTLTNFGNYDFYILASSTRFYDNDIWLANTIAKMGKHFYFVRTKFGNNVESEWKKQRRKKRSKEDIEKDLRMKIFEECKTNLMEFECRNNIFIVDSYETYHYDFIELGKRIIRDASEISEKKQTVIILSLSAMTKPAIEEKKHILQKRISRTALRASFALRIKRSDVRILMEEEAFYRNQFKLDAESLEKDAMASNIQSQLTDLELKLQSTGGQTTENEHILNEVESLIPFLLPFVNIVKTYKLSKLWLRNTLESIVDSAIAVNEAMVKGLARS
ncbi:T-cell-specific guanine nucleotide triphosphate-binding protein 2-like [Mercenaria mercenaria]|uniref:T-cell-specific guanine nucleotide triphosphate-binding protein 2-like n=1 Tax=Mercenaria mercenaria TaxID=6596 RepID=UPI00234EB3CF|nr:T-cell-specific guanine nucleotide triphosphate-binding protein 2-like [Mercenaria mercenaria]